MPYIYLIHCRASVNAQEPVFKLGKTIDFSKRVGGYDKGSNPILSLYVKECDETEKRLIKLFKTNFKHRPDYGREYFEGNVDAMVMCIVTSTKHLRYMCQRPSLPPLFLPLVALSGTQWAILLVLSILFPRPILGAIWLLSL
jgi:hypothetical protein